MISARDLHNSGQEMLPFPFSVTRLVHKIGSCCLLNNKKCKVLLLMKMGTTPTIWAHKTTSSKKNFELYTQTKWT